MAVKTAAEVRAYKRDWARNKRGYIAPSERECVICSIRFMPPIHHPKAEVCGQDCSKKLDYMRHKERYFARALNHQRKNPLLAREYQKRTHGIRSRRWNNGYSMDGNTKKSK